VPFSDVESFHDNQSHFENWGMRALLSDNLNLAGTARYNLSIRHKLSLVNENQSARKNIPAAWEDTVPYLNHTMLAHINKIAAEIGIGLPFKKLETLVEDSGERFFLEYPTLIEPLKQQNDACNLCLCSTCKTLQTEPICFGGKALLSLCMFALSPLLSLI
jgi:hypothetical protein